MLVGKSCFGSGFFRIFWPVGFRKFIFAFGSEWMSVDFELLSGAILQLYLEYKPMIYNLFFKCFRFAGKGGYIVRTIFHKVNRL